MLHLREIPMPWDIDLENSKIKFENLARRQAVGTRNGNKSNTICPNSLLIIPSKMPPVGPISLEANE